ncbi:HNH endonuclease family protein, partial [Conchiformibius steedae]|uniref:HNH endonuclease family protein n=1 Tax=Conchiformibius steedae TaxID=153493 RepID=UPI0026EED4F8
DYPYIEIKQDLHTEHILPKEWTAKGMNWKKDFSPKVAEALLNSLGNLTLLSGNKNILASNRNYRDKCEIYAGKGLDGKTSFEITKRVFEETPEQWTPETIENRKEWLVEQVKAIFDIAE